MTNFFAVFIGGGLGSILRYAISLYFLPHKFTFPFATLIANGLSCIVLGFLSFVLHQNVNLFSPQLRLLAITGFCGGFSTYSTFTAETFSLLQNGDWTLAFFNIFGNLFLCLICILAGMGLGKLIF